MWHTTKKQFLRIMNRIGESDSIINRLIIVFTWNLSLFFSLGLVSRDLDTCCGPAQPPSGTLVRKERRSSKRVQTASVTVYIGVITQRCYGSSLNLPKRGGSSYTLTLNEKRVSAHSRSKRSYCNVCMGSSEGRMDREIDRRIGAEVRRELSQKSRLSFHQSIHGKQWLMTQRRRWQIQGCLSVLHWVAGLGLSDTLWNSNIQKEL